MLVNYNAHGKQDRLLLGLGLMVLGELFLVIGGAMIKELSSHLPLSQIIFFRNLFGFLFINVLFVRQGFSSLKSAQPFTQLLRGVVGICAMACMVFTYSELQLSEATLLKATTPLFIPVIAFILLHEKVSLMTVLAIVIAFVGVVFINGNGGNEPSSGLSMGWVSGICAAIFAAVAKVFVRKLGRTDPSKVIIFYFALIGTIISFPFALYQWQNMNMFLVLMVIALGLFSTIGQLSLTKAYTVAPAGKIGVYGYSSLPIAGLIGWFVWQEPLTVQLAIGMLIIIFAGLLNIKVSK